MRKLPVFFLIDLSESMVGKPIDLVKMGMEHLIRSLKKNPYALETVWIEIIGFAGKAKVIEPFEELPLFYPPNFPIGGGTSISSGLEFLMKEIDANVNKSTANTKGDWKPLVFLFTDGQPTDNYETTVIKWKNNYKDKCQTLMATLGDVVSNDFINSIADEAIQLENSSQESFESYFKWLTDSIVSSSIQVSEGIEPTGKNENLQDGISRIDLNKTSIEKSYTDDNCTVLLGSCQTNNEKYLIKYNLGIETNFEDVGSVGKIYRLEGAYKLNYETYKELSGENNTTKVDAKYLRGIPSCPNCNSKHALAVCECGGVFCFDSEKQAQTCGWCDTTAYYSAVDGDFNLDRRQG